MAIDGVSKMAGRTTGALRRARRKVADRADHVEPADPHAGEEDRRHGDHEAHRHPVDEAGRRERERDVEPGPVLRPPLEDLRRRERNPVADAEPEQDTRDDRGDRIGRALQGQRADEPGALHADGAEHAQLGLPLLREHHEDVHQQQRAGDDAEAADHQEQRAQGVAHLLGLLEDVALRCLHRDRVGGGAELLLDEPGHVRGQRVAALHVTPVGHERDDPRLTRRRLGRDVQQPLGEERVVVRGRAEAGAGEAALGQDPIDAQRLRGSVQEEGHLVAGRHSEAVRQRLVEHDRAGCGAGSGEAGVTTVAPELGGLGEVDVPGEHAWLRGLPGVGDGDGCGLVDPGGEHAVDVGVAREVREPDGRSLGDGGVGGEDPLVDRTERPVGVLADGVVQRVADDERADDDRRAEHGAGDDERRLGLAPRHLPDGETPGDGLSGEEYAEPECADADEREQWSEQVRIHVSRPVLAASPR
jgi:hypothetical protein